MQVRKIATTIPNYRALVTPDVKLPLRHATGDRAVALGVMWLDGACPDWHTRITKSVDLKSNFNCVGGQVFGSYSGMLRRAPVWLSPIGQHRWAEQHGFIGIRHERAWKAVIAERRTR